MLQHEVCAQTDSHANDCRQVLDGGWLRVAVLQRCRTILNGGDLGQNRTYERIWNRKGVGIYKRSWREEREAQLSEICEVHLGYANDSDQS